MIDPVALRIALDDIYDRYTLPLIIVEDGIGVSEDITEDGKIHVDKYDDGTTFYFFNFQRNK